MAFEYGFYNSISGDRKYNAIQFGQIFDGVINDGVFLSIGEKFATLVGGGMDVTVGTGKAWFNHTWNLNTTKIPFTLENSHPVLTRYDAIVLEVNDSPDVYGRVNSIKVVKGEPSSNAVKPTLVNDQYIHQYPLSYIKINPGATDIVAADIEIMVGQSPCPYVTGILQTTDITELYNNWEGQFNTWFDNLKAQLTDNVVTNLQNQIDQCLKPTDIATAEDINNGTPGKLVEASGLKNNAMLASLAVGDIFSTQRYITDHRFLMCNGLMYQIEKYPDWWNAVKSPFNKIDRTMWSDYRTAPRSINKQFISKTSSGTRYFCGVEMLASSYITFNVYNLYMFENSKTTINFRDNINPREIFNIIREASIKGDNNKNVYILMSSGSTTRLTILELKNGSLQPAHVTEFTRDLSLDAVGSVFVTNSNSYVVLENDTFHVYCVYGNQNVGALYYFSFYLDRANKEIRLVTKNTQIPVIDQNGTAIQIAKMNCPGMIADSGNIYFGALSADKKRLLMLKITNKNTCSVVKAVAPTDYEVTYNTSFYRFSIEDQLYIHAAGNGSDGTNGIASVGYIGVSKHSELFDMNIETNIFINSGSTTDSMFYNLITSGAGLILGFLDISYTVIYYNKYIWIVYASLFYSKITNPAAVFYCDLNAPSPNLTETLFSKMYDFGYLDPDYYMLSFPINNSSQYVYYPELATPNVGSRCLKEGYFEYIKVKP